MYLLTEKTPFMKKFTFLSMLIVMPMLLHAQQTQKTNGLSRDQYMQRSKSQSKTGLIILGSGVVLGTIGYITFSQNFDLSSGNSGAADAGGFMFLAGTAAVLTSVGFFIASAVNRGKANSMTLNLKMEKGAPGIVYRMAPTYFPAVSVRFPIR